MPFIFDVLRNGLNFTLTTDLGDIDLLGEITGGGGYDALYPDTLAWMYSESNAAGSTWIG